MAVDTPGRRSRRTWVVDRGERLARLNDSDGTLHGIWQSPSSRIWPAHQDRETLAVARFHTTSDVVLLREK